MTGYDVVVPTIGRPCLRTLLDALGDGPGQTLVVDDRPDATAPLDVPPWVKVLRGRAAGPAAARNTGWRAATATWVAFLDDDVVPPPGWRDALERDLAACGADVAASQGRIVVPLPPDRAPTDWERNVAGLETAQWATADMAYRRDVLDAVGGFDERFPRAYREDADLGLRVTGRGWVITGGDRHVLHPVRPADRWVSVRLQRGNADDVLMRRLHGPDWRRRAGVPRGRRPWHLATTTAGILAAAAPNRRTRRVAGLLWLVLTADFARRRIAPGPRTPDELLTMAATSAVVPPAAAWHWLRAAVSRPPAAAGR